MSAMVCSAGRLGASSAPPPDVIWVQSLASDGIQRAYELGMMSIGFFSDARLTVGDTVITSVVIDFAPPSPPPLSRPSASKKKDKQLP